MARFHIQPIGRCGASSQWKQMRTRPADTAYIDVDVPAYLQRLRRYARPPTSNVRIRPVATTKAARFVAPCASLALHPLTPHPGLSFSTPVIPPRACGTRLDYYRRTHSESERDRRKESVSIDVLQQARTEGDARVNSDRFEHGENRRGGATEKKATTTTTTDGRFARGARRTRSTVWANLRTCPQMRCADWSPSTPLSLGRRGEEGAEGAASPSSTSPQSYGRSSVSAQTPPTPVVTN